MHESRPAARQKKLPGKVVVRCHTRRGEVDLLGLLLRQRKKVPKLVIRHEPARRRCFLPANATALERLQDTLTKKATDTTISPAFHLNAATIFEIRFIAPAHRR